MNRAELLESSATSQSRRCPSCRSDRLADFFESRFAPVRVGELAESREAALRAPLGEIVLAHCLSCGFTFNRCFDPGLVDFKPGYDASLVYSDTFRSFLEDVAEGSSVNSVYTERTSSRSAAERVSSCGSCASGVRTTASEST